MREDVYTEDFADICSCSRERGILIDIMKAWGEHGLPDDFSDSRVRPAFNRNSGNVFLVNEDYEVCMLRNGRLESFYTSPYDGQEGFFDDLAREYGRMCVEDREWLRQIANGREIPNA